MLVSIGLSSKPFPCRNPSLPDNALNFSQYVDQYAAPLYVDTITHALRVKTNSSLKYISVKYEDLKENTLDILDDVLEFLGDIPVSAT